MSFITEAKIKPKPINPEDIKIINKIANKKEEIPGILNPITIEIIKIKIA